MSAFNFIANAGNRRWLSIRGHQVPCQASQHRGDGHLDIYHIWCDLKSGEDDLEFVAAASAYLDELKTRSVMVAYRITRRKLGLAPAHLREFHLMLEFDNLAQMDDAFGLAAARDDPIDGFHLAMNQRVARIDFALYRDFPDAVRVESSLQA